MHIWRQIQKEKGIKILKIYLIDSEKKWSILGSLLYAILSLVAGIKKYKSFKLTL